MRAMTSNETIVRPGFDMSEDFLQDVYLHSENMGILCVGDLK